MVRMTRTIPVFFVLCTEHYFLRTISCALYSPVPEEVPEEGGAVSLPDAGVDPGLVAEALEEQVDHAAAGAGDRFPSAVDHRGDPGVDDGPGAHGAGLQGDGEGAALQTPVPQGPAGLADGLDLGVGGGVGILLTAVPAPADDPALPVHNDAAHRHFSGLGGLLCQGEGLQHVGFLIHDDPPEG